MINLQSPKAHKLVSIIAIFNLFLLALDWFIVYVSSRRVEELYNQLGIQAIYNVGVYFFKLRAAIIIVATLVAVFKFWEVKGRSVGSFEKWILRFAFILLIIGTVAALETFVETLIRFI